MSEAPHFLKDLEVREIQSLDHARLAESVFAGIELSSPPFRLALFGPWGSGKTTILKLVQAQLEEYVSEGGDIFFRAAWFNAWDHESSANLFHSLVRALVDEIPDGVRFSRRGSRVVQRVVEGARVHGRRWGSSKAGEAVLGSGVVPGAPPDDAEEYGVESIRSDLERFTEMILVGGGKARPRRLVVFIDDLDKCLPLHALAFLESVKLFFSRQAPIVFVCSMDDSVLRRVVQAKYGYSEPGFAESYIEKIFEFGYQVPGIGTPQISGLVQEIFRRSGLGSRQVPQERLAMERRVIESVLSRSGLALNPRRIKRIFNRFVWFFSQTELLDSEAADQDELLEPWLTWLLATEYWRELREFVGDFGEIALRELGNRVTGHPLFPHSSEGCKAAFNNMTDSRALIEFFRGSISVPSDPHRPEAQQEIRNVVMRFADVDQTLRTLGL